MQKKSKTKSLLAVLLAVMMILSCVPVSFAASEPLKFSVSESGDSYMVVKCYATAAGTVVVPSTHNEKPVLKICTGAFSENENITAVEISNGISEIETEAFTKCPNLVSITVPKSVTAIGERAFGYNNATEPVGGFTVLGYANSEASAYAKANGFDFKNICPHAETELIGKVDATCTEKGYTGDKVCKDCSETVEKGSELDVVPHNFEEWSVLRKSTCSAFGKETSTCTVCGAFGEREIEKLPHAEETIPAVEATCEKTGLTEGKKCSVCGEIIVAQETVLMKEHTASEAVKENEVSASCKAEGSYDSVVYCSVCGAEISREKITTEKLPHAEETIPAVEATCEKTGLTEGKKCSVCGEIIVEQKEVPMKEHTFGDWYETKAATCTENGEEERKCSSCEKTETKEIPINPEKHTGETEVRNAVTPTCKEGYTGDVYCLGCGVLIESGRNVKEPSNHDGGTEVRNAVDVTCTENGYSGDVYCLGCGVLVETGRVLMAEGHTFGEWVTVPATCKDEGSKTRVCSKCGESEAEKLEKDPSNHASKGELKGKIELSCTENGYTGDLVCPDCGTVLQKGEELIAKGHVDENEDGICDVCEKKLNEEPEAPCDCACHQKGLKKLWFKICLFFQMIFDKNQVCKCGKLHY